MGEIFLLSLTAAFNPTLVAATTVMLMLANPKRLMLGYLIGALMTSITLGIVIVFALQNSGAVSTTQRSVNPAVDLALGAIALISALAVATDRHSRVLERRRRRAAKKQDKDKAPPRWQRALGRGSARTTFAVGALLTLPGASYLAGLHRVDQLHYSRAATVAIIVAFNLIMLALIEVPLLCFVIAPDWTPGAVQRAKSWASSRARRIAIIVLGAIGTALVIKGIGGLLS